MHVKSENKKTMKALAWPIYISSVLQANILAVVYK